MLSSMKGGEHDFLVLMGGSGHQDRLNLVGIENLAVVVETVGVGRRFLSALQKRRISVANRDDRGIGQSCQRVRNFAAPHSAADDRAIYRRAGMLFLLDRGSGRGLIFV